MKYGYILSFVIIAVACGQKEVVRNEIGTWRLIKGEVIEGNDTTHVDYTNNEECLKIINSTHFSFLRHDLSKGEDSSKVIFVSGGGRCELSDSSYTEYLDFCNYREWEGGVFNLSLKVNGDTLVQEGVEKVESLGINRYNIETYIRE